MAAELENLIDQLQQIVQEASSVPFTNDKCIIERDRALEIIEELKTNLPSDLKMAADIVQKRNDMMEAGRREVEALQKRAQEVAQRKVSETEIVQESRKKAKEILMNAELQTRELRKAANEYCDDALKRTEEAVARTMTEVKESRARFRDSARNSQQ